MKENKSISYDIKVLIISLIITLIFMGFITIVGVDSTKYTEITYQLSELTNGTYGVYYTTHSNVPAKNYEVITLNCEGNIYTFQGHVQVTYTDESPYVIYQDSNMVGGDKIYVYVPQGTIEYQASVGLK